MDPVSPFAILSAVTAVGGAVLDLSTRLYSFMKATKVVDKSVEELYREVQGLENVLNTAQNTLAETVRDHAQDLTLSVNGVWTSFKNGVDDCRVTVKALDSIVQDFGVDSGSSNPFKKAFKQVKLSLSTDQITTVRGRVHTHSICLQLVLQMLDVSLSCSSRTDIKNVVIPDLEIIISKLDNLASAIAGPRVAQSLEDANLPIIFRNPDLDDHTQRLKSRADAALINASSVIDAGSTQREGTYYAPDTFSEFGVPLSTAKRVGIMEWAQELDMDVREPRSKGWSSVTSVDQIASSSNSISNPTKIEKDLSLRIVKEIFDKAEGNWAKANYLEAEKFFRAGMDRVETLGISKQQVLNLNEIRLKLAFTTLHQRDYSEAIKLFISLFKPVRGSKGFLNSILKKSAIEDDVRCRNYAYFGLAQAYLGQGSLGDAEIWCQKCNECWKARTQRKAHPLYSKSLQLMAYIHQVKDDSITANALFEVAVQEGLEINETTPFMLDPESFPAFRVLRILNHDIFSNDFDATKSLSSLAGCVDRFTSTETAEAVKLLLNKGANPDMSLMKACEYGNVPAAEQLCQSGANVNAVDHSGETPLLKASRCGHVAIVKLLCDQGADKEAMDSDGTALCKAVSEGQTAVIELLLKEGALTTTASERWTPLHFAVSAFKPDAVKALCAAGADVNAKTEHGETPLSIALVKFPGGHDDERLAIVETLCESGADVPATMRDGRWMLDLARMRKDFRDVLEQYGAKY